MAEADLFGEQVCDKLIGRIKRIVGYMPNF